MLLRVELCGSGEIARLRSTWLTHVVCSSLASQLRTLGPRMPWAGSTSAVPPPTRHALLWQLACLGSDNITDVAHVMPGAVGDLGLDLVQRRQAPEVPGDHCVGSYQKSYNGSDS